MDFMNEALSNTLMEYCTGEYLNQRVVVVDDFKADSIGMAPEIAEMLGLDNGDYVFVTPMQGEADMTFMACFKVALVNFDNASQTDLLPAVISTKVAEKLMDNQWDGKAVSIFSIKPSKVASAFESFSIIRFFREGTENTNGNVGKPIDIPFELVRCSLEQALAQTINVPDNTQYFTMVTYLCPICHNNLAKLLINPMTLNDNGRTDTYNRIFTCCKCNTIIAPTGGQNLSTGTFNFVRLDSDSYQNVIAYYERNARL